MNDAAWFDIVVEASLLQGDVINGCPVSEIIFEPNQSTKTEQLRGEFVQTELVVMTQSCDLENNKVAHVLLAQQITWSDVVRDELECGNHGIKSRDVRKKLIECNVPGLSLLHKHGAAPKLDWSVVEFHRLYTLPKSFLEQYAQSLGPRLRLRSPYREHLARAFARYFMRVGLPHDAKAFEKEGDVPLGS